MKLFMGGKWKFGFSKTDGRNIPPPPNNPPPEPPHNGVNHRQQNSKVTTQITTQRNESQSSPMLRNLQHLNLSRSGFRESADETSSTSSEKYERDVTILNCCFDDIERFIGRLQSAAAAYRELERRRRTRKGKKKDHGEGMLSMRAKPPPEKEFIDILQKFKLSFNLLAKLKSHIHDPNAPELVHFLFTPLALIMDASRDSNYGPNLAGKVTSPLLTRDAVDLLTNCLTSKESDLWHSLGDAWIIPREQWKDYVSPYHPVFFSGWAPDYPFNEDRERAEMTAMAAASVAQQSRHEEILKAQHDAENREQAYQRMSGPDARFTNNFYYANDREQPSPLPSVDERRQQFDSPYEPHLDERRSFERERARSPHSDREFHDPRDRDGRSDISTDSIERTSLDPQRQFDRHQAQWLEEIRMRGGKVVQVTYPRTANNDKELTVFRGEFLEVLDDSRKWWKTRNIRGQVAHVPHTIVTPFHPSDEDGMFNNPLYMRNSRERLYGQESPNRSGDEGFARSGGGAFGRSPNPSVTPAEWVRQERQGRKDDAISPTSPERRFFPPTPPAPPPPPSMPVITNRNTSNTINNNTNNNTSSDLQMERIRLQQISVTNELKMRQQQKSLFPKPIAPSAFISDASTSDELHDWFIAKEFKPTTIQILEGLSGADVFALSRSQLQNYCGFDEGNRLYSQLTIQKNTSGYKTTRTKEFNKVLARQRQRTSNEPIEDYDDN